MLECVVNIKKVAEMAGVSVATVSRVLNHPERVLPETRERVHAVMKEKNYTPNWFARGLNLGKTYTIALLVPNIENGLYQKIISGIETVAYNKQNAVFLCDTRSSGSAEFDYLKMVIERRVDGVVLVSSLMNDQQAGLLSDSRIPCVHIGKHLLPGCETRCYIDYEEGVCRLTGHLISLGHRRIDLLLDSAESRESAQIEAGFYRACGESGCTGRLHHGENSVQGGYIAAGRLLQSESLPDALVTISHEQAFGVMKAAQDAELHIPDRLALACMTDSAMSSIVTPPLTSLEQPTMRLGMVAARMLFDAIEHDEFEIDVPQEMILQSKLKIRKSCGNTKHIYELFD